MSANGRFAQNDARMRPDPLGIDILWRIPRISLALENIALRR